MKAIKDNIRPLTLMLAIPIMNITYILINKLSDVAYDITLSLDDRIPFLKVFVIPYIVWYLFIPAAFLILCLKDKKSYFKAMLIYITGCLIASIIFLTYQTTVPRTPIAGNDILTKIVVLIQENDKPVNCLPSLHVFTSYLIMRAALGSSYSNFKINLITCIVGASIILSTLFTKQHAILDVVSGILLAELLFFFVNKYEDKLLTLWNKKPFSFFSSNKIKEEEIIEP